MVKQAVSVTLERENLLWLRGQVRAAGRKSLSEVLDRLVAEARAGGRVHEATIRSVVGTVHIADADPDLAQADAVVRSLFPRPSPLGRKVEAGSRVKRPSRHLKRRRHRG